ncbi:MAG: SusE domain-containing protein, partial [Bacteroidales bacterium]|nr:SusE domain-containing protein [Bacteroidales bacterium]
MKKLLYTFFVAAAGLMLASCKQEHIEVVYNPDATTVQTLGNFSETVLTDGGADLVATFTPADFKIDAAKSYVLYTSSAADMSDKSKMAAKIRVNEDESAGQVTLTQKDLNSKILSLGGEADVPFTLYFQLGASIANDKGNAIASTEVLSNI